MISRLSKLLLPVLLSITCAGQQLTTVQASIHVHHVRGSDANDDSNVVLWLTPLNGTPDLKASQLKHYQIEQKNKSFIPHVLAVPVGAKIQFPNKDPFFHNVFSLYKGSKFDLGLYEAGSSREVLFDRPGVSFIFCNIHPNMSAYVLALETPYFDTSGKNGHILISDVEPGKYRLHVWYERAETADLEKLSRVVDVQRTELNLGEIDVPESPRFQPTHPNKLGKPYDPEQPPY